MGEVEDQSVSWKCMMGHLRTRLQLIVFAASMLANDLVTWRISDPELLPESAPQDLSHIRLTFRSPRPGNALRTGPRFRRRIQISTDVEQKGTPR